MSNAETDAEKETCILCAGKRNIRVSPYQAQKLGWTGLTGRCPMCELRTQLAALQLPTDDGEAIDLKDVPICGDCYRPLGYCRKDCVQYEDHTSMTTKPKGDEGGEIWAEGETDDIGLGLRIYQTFGRKSPEAQTYDKLSRFICAPTKPALKGSRDQRAGVLPADKVHALLDITEMVSSMRVSEKMWDLISELCRYALKTSQQAGEVRKDPSLIVFLGKMQAQLDLNASRGGWEGCSLGFLLERMASQVRDLPNYHKNDMGKLVQTTCADLANFAMMFSENSAALRQSKEGK